MYCPFENTQLAGQFMIVLGAYVCMCEVQVIKLYVSHCPCCPPRYNLTSMLRVIVCVCVHIFRIYAMYVNRIYI